MRRTLLTIAALSFATGSVFGWGRDGHRIVADIAARDLTPQAQAAVEALLGGQTMVDVCVWADEVRRQEEYRWSAPHHYVNIEPGFPSYDEARDCPDVGCAVTAIKEHEAVLRGNRGSDKAREESLKFLIHFVGDLHQPLHTGRKSDRGGNDVKVTLLGSETNLHGAWDYGMLETVPMEWADRADMLYGRIDDQQRGSWSDLDPGHWATESNQIAAAFGYALTNDGVIDQSDIDRSLPLIEWRLEQAGVRLAMMLNDIFEDAPLPATDD